MSLKSHPNAALTLVIGGLLAAGAPGSLAHARLAPPIDDEGRGAQGPAPDPARDGAPSAGTSRDAEGSGDGSKKSAVPNAAALDRPSGAAEPLVEKVGTGITPKDDPGDAEREPMATMIEGKPLPLSDAVELALQNHPAIRNAELQTQAAETRVGQAKADYYPQIQGWLQYLRATENGSPTSVYSIPGLARVGGSTPDGVGALDSFNNYIAAVVLRQLIWDFGRTQGQVEAQKAFTELAKVNEELVRQTVAFGVMRAYYDVWAARATVALAQENEKTALAILELAEAAHRAGLKPESESARARAAVASAKVAIIRAEAQLDVARAGVANAVGIPQGNYEPTGYAFSPGAIQDEDELIEQAMASRPELAIIEKQKDGLEGTRKAVRGQQLPRFDAIVGVNTRGQFLTGSGQDPFNRFNAHAGIVLNVPMFQGMRVRKQKQEIDAQLAAADQRSEGVRQAVILEIRRAMANVKAADAAAEASEQGVEAARKAVEILEGRYPEGLTKLVELTDAQRAYIDARAQQVRATYDRFLARAALSIAIGQPQLETKQAVSR